MGASTYITAWFVHEVIVQRYAGRGVSGPVYDDGTTEAALVIDKRATVKSATGETVISPTAVYLADGTDGIPTGSLVTLPATFCGRTAEVISVSVLSTGLGTPDHVELRLS
jgi:hypothetical protein